MNALEYDGNTDDDDSVNLDQDVKDNGPNEHAFYDADSSEDDE